MICLYLKIHNVTGYKYLGKTSQDPYVYPGSGIKWKRHIKKYGNDVTTIILAQVEDGNDLREIGILYSDMLDVVKSDDYANMVVEQGNGGNNVIWTEDRRCIHRGVMQEILARPEVQEKRRRSLQSSWTQAKRQTQAAKTVHSIEMDPTILDRNRRAAKQRHMAGAYLNSWSESRKEAQSKRMNATGNPMFGRTHTDNARHAISAGLAGRPKAASHTLAISQSLTGLIRPKTHHCEYCNQWFTKSMFNRWHGNHCKRK